MKFAFSKISHENFLSKQQFLHYQKQNFINLIQIVFLIQISNSFGNKKTIMNFLFTVMKNK